MQIRALLVALAAVTVSPLAAHAATVDPAQAIAQKFSEASDEKPAPPPKRTYDAPGASYEADMLEQARAEEHERKRDETKQNIAKSPVVAQPVLAPPILSPPVVAPVAVAPEVVTPAPVVPTMPLPAQASAPPPAAAPGPQLAALPVKALPEPAPVEPAHSLPAASTVTVLLVLDPDNLGLGFRPDPILCIDNRCWISNGIGLPARAMPRNEAVALQGTDSVAQDSCGGKSGCVYRNVAIDPSARIDIIEVGEGGGASAGTYTAIADQSCRKQGDALVCDNGLATQNFHIWIVPEVTAGAVGVSSLENAVAEGLPEFNVSQANDK